MKKTKPLFLVMLGWFGVKALGVRIFLLFLIGCEVQNLWALKLQGKLVFLLQNSVQPHGTLLQRSTQTQTAAPREVSGVLLHGRSYMHNTKTMSMFPAEELNLPRPLFHLHKHQTWPTNLDNQTHTNYAHTIRGHAAFLDRGMSSERASNTSPPR